jgi:prevent-host-death family protein
MEKTVGASEIRRNLGKVLQEVAADGNRYIIERYGEPIAAVVPLAVYEQWKRRRVFDQLHRAQAQANLAPDAADALAAEAVKAARRR